MPWRTPQEDLRISGPVYHDFDLNIVHRTGIKTEAANALSKLEKGRMDTTHLDDASAEMMVSLIEQGGTKIIDDHDKILHLLSTVQWCVNTVETVSSTLI